MQEAALTSFSLFDPLRSLAHAQLLIFMTT